MRMNSPVTNVERHLGDGEYIVSKTDLKGRITYVNQPFMDISGFTASELIGASHNIVRHPDMPPAAFADLWRTLKDGKPWRGMVKNRCKNGDYYWVDANANPIWEGGRITGYMSLRMKPSRAQVEAAEHFYKLFREGTARGYGVKEGRVVRTGWRGALAALTRVGLQTRMSAICALLAITVIAFSGVLWSVLPGSAMRAALSLIAGLALVLDGWMWWTLRSKVFRALDEVGVACQTLASGNLAFDAAADMRSEVDRIRYAVNIMAGNLTSIVNDFRSAAENLSSVSHEVNATAQSFSRRIQRTSGRRGENRSFGRANVGFDCAQHGERSSHQRYGSEGRARGAGGRQGGA